MRLLAFRSFFPTLLRALAPAAVASAALACGGDEFVASPGAKGGSAGSAGGSAAGSAGASTAGAAGTSGVAGAAGAPVGGSAGASSGGASGQNAGGSAGSSAGSGGNAGAGGNAAGSAGAGGAAGPSIGAVSLKVFPNKDCAGDTYKNVDNSISVPQGGGEACVQLTGAFFDSDVVKIDGDIVTKKLGTGVLATTWTIPHGGGTTKRTALVEVLRGADAVKLSVDITPRAVAENGSDTLGVGTTLRPWKTLQKALSGAKNDAIVLSGNIDPGSADAAVTVFDVPAGASITAAAGSTPTLKPLVPFALHDGAKIAGITVDCEKVLGPCVQPVEGGSTVEDVVLTAKEGGYAVLKPGVKLSVVGGKVTSPSAFLHTGAGSTLRLSHAKANHVASNGICQQGLRAVATTGQPPPILDLDATGEPTTFDGYGTCFGIYLEGGVQGALQNLKVSRSGLGGGGPSIAVLLGTEPAVLRNITVEQAVGIGVAAGGGKARLEGVRVAGSPVSCLNLGQGTFEISDIVLSDCANHGIDIDEDAKVVASGTVDLSWAVATPIGPTSGSAMRVNGSFEQSDLAGKTVLKITNPPFPAIGLAGNATFKGTKGQPDGLQIQGARSASILFSGKYDLALTNGKIDSAAPTSELFVLDARAGAGKAIISGTEFLVGGSSTGIGDAAFTPKPGEYSNKQAASLRTHVVTTAPPASPQLVHTLELPPASNTNGDVVFLVYP